MARLFTAASNEIAAYTGGAPATAVPLTIVAWVRKPSNPLTTRWAVALKNTASATVRNGFFVGMTAAGVVEIQTAASAASTAATAGTVSNNTWTHIGGVFASATSYTAYMNGTAGTAATTSRVPSGINSVTVGAELVSGSTVSRPWNGDIAEVAVWSVALSADEMALLAKGLSPVMIKPESLIFYPPIFGKNSPENDYVGNYNLTLTGTSASEHPRIIRPSAKILTFPSGGSSLNVSATTDALTLAEYAATIGKDLNVSANTDSLTLAEHAATVSLVSGLNVNATTDALTLAEHAATIGLSLNVQAATDALTLTEYPASLGNTLDVQATTAALTLTEYPATLSFALNVSATTDSLTLVEYGAAISDANAVTTAAEVSRGGWYFPKVKRREWREQSAKARREYLERLLDAAEVAPDEVREEVEEILERVTGQEDEDVNVAQIDIARVNRLITQIERAIQEEDDTLFLLMAS